MITIINYGLGNIRAFVNVYKRLNIEIAVATEPEEVRRATKLILPGVGAFDYAMTQMNRSGMRNVLEEKVLGQKVPVMGICVGMQMLAKSSEEGVLPGLGWIDGLVRRMDETKIPFKTRLPHMGWNTIRPVKSNPLLAGIKENASFYFLHSYYFQERHPDHVISKTIYGSEFTSAINSGNVWGVQFHPEKSHSNGVTVLLNYHKL